MNSICDELSQKAKLFHDTAIRYAEASEAKNFKVSDKCAEDLFQLAKELRHSFGEEGRSVLVGFMTNGEITELRSIAAAFSLDFRSSEAESILESISKTPGMAGFPAEIALQEWRAGRKTFPGGPVAKNATIA